MPRKVYNVREIENVEKPFYEACKKRGWWCAKWVPTAKRGVPDRMVLRDIQPTRRRLDDMLAGAEMFGEHAGDDPMRELLGMCIEFVELKKPGKEPEPRQLRRHKELRALGFTVTVLDSPEAVRKWADG